MNKLALVIVTLAALNIAVSAIFGYDFLGDVFSGETMSLVVGIVIGLSGLAVAKEHLLGGGE